MNIGQKLLKLWNVEQLNPIKILYKSKLYIWNRKFKPIFSLKNRTPYEKVYLELD